MPNDITVKTPKYLHLDRRADQIIELGAGHSDDELLSGEQLARWLGVSVQWPAMARISGTGPPFVRIGPKRIRYRRDAVNNWLKQREVASTANSPSHNRGERRANGDNVGGRPKLNAQPVNSNPDGNNGSAVNSANPQNLTKHSLALRNAQAVKPALVGYKRGN